MPTVKKNWPLFQKYRKLIILNELLQFELAAFGGYNELF